MKPGEPLIIHLKPKVILKYEVFVFICASILGSYKTKNTCYILCVARAWWLITYASVKMLCKFVKPPNVMSSFKDILKIYSLTISSMHFETFSPSGLPLPPSARSGPCLPMCLFYFDVFLPLRPIQVYAGLLAMTVGVSLFTRVWAPY